MTSSTTNTGTVQMAAALTFHLPGARLVLSDPNGASCSIGPLTDPRSMMHPAEFRELVITSAADEVVGTLLGCVPDTQPTLSLAAAGVDHLGGGLYRVAGGDSTSYAFATTLEARKVDAVLSNIEPGDRGDNATSHNGVQEAVGVHIIQDDGLRVTFVVVCSSDLSDSPISRSIAKDALSACLVAEMENLGNGGGDASSP